jgi:hypothetical protein
VTHEQLEGEVLAVWFPEESAGAPHASATPRDASLPPAGSAHDLALLFVILCFGALGDTRVLFPGATAQDGLRPGESIIDVDGSPKTSSASSNHASPLNNNNASSSSNHTSPSLNHTTTSNNTSNGNTLSPAHWYRLTKAALILSPVLEGPPSVVTVQTLALMAIYEGLCAGENSIESTWAIFGLATKLAQNVSLSSFSLSSFFIHALTYPFFSFRNLDWTTCVSCLSFASKLNDVLIRDADRDCARWGLKPGEVWKRRALFWELFITDYWQVSWACGSLVYLECYRWLVHLHSAFQPHPTSGH